MALLDNNVYSSLIAAACGAVCLAWREWRIRQDFQRAIRDVRDEFLGSALDSLEVEPAVEILLGLPMSPNVAVSHVSLADTKLLAQVSSILSSRA